MSLRRLIVEVNVEELNVREFCAQHGVSRWFFYDLRRRYRAHGEAVLVARSRAPRRVANRTRPELEERIVALRKDLEADGFDAGPATIRYHLCRELRDRRGTRTPSEATIWRVLVRRGFVVAQPHKAPRHAHRCFSAERANECWQVDDTGWQLTDGTGVKIIDVVDDCTRLAVGSQAVPACTAAAALDTVLAAASQWGLPERLLSDNATAFRHGLVEALSVFGVAAGHSRPYHPQTCGKVERFHQTLKRFLAAQPRAATLDELQAQLDRFRAYYNHHRPHRALRRRHPAEVWAATPKSGPATRPLHTATVIYHARVEPTGSVSAGKYTISVGTAYAGTRATSVITGRACHVFIDGRLARRLTLDPSRRVQPIYNRRGRPTDAQRRHATTTGSTVRDVPRHA